MQKCINFNDTDIVFVKRSDYRIHIWYVNKNDAINIMKNSDLKKWLAINFFPLYIKMGETTDYKRNRETVLNRAKDYYENNKEVLREKERNKYRQSFEEEKKNIKREDGRNRHHTTSEAK